jgi:hypothetical protein
MMCHAFDKSWSDWTALAVSVLASNADAHPDSWLQMLQYM